MADAAAITGVVWEDSVPFLMARLIGNDGSALTQAGVTSIAYTVVDIKSAPNTLVLSGTLVVATVMFNAYQTDARWTVDATGYNFGAVLPVTAFPNGGRCYFVDIVITPAVGAAIPLCFQIHTESRYRGT